jgi:hypothetical protein
MTIDAFRVALRIDRRPLTHVVVAALLGDEVQVTSSDRAVVDFTTSSDTFPALSIPHTSSIGVARFWSAVLIDAFEGAEVVAAEGFPCALRQSCAIVAIYDERALLNALSCGQVPLTFGEGQTVARFVVLPTIW